MSKIKFTSDTTSIYRPQWIDLGGGWFLAWYMPWARQEEQP